MTKEKKLSERQENILKYIAEYITDKNRPPTIREIGSNVKISSTSVVNYNLQRLKERGLLARDKEVSRGLRLTTRGYSTVGIIPPTTMGSFRIPLMGNIVAGEPIDVFDNPYDDDDMIEISESLLSTNPKDLFALKVDGYSMIDAMVNDGDIVILRRQETARNGDMVAARITTNDTTTLKYWFYENDQIRLQPANPTMEPIFVDPRHIAIQGKVEMVIRQL